MPALRVDVKLSAASVGALDAVDKDDIYVKDPTQDDGYPHNLYAPFYKAFIPAASPGSGRSGVAGSFANNFPGFLEDGVYDFWNIKGWVWRDGDNGCRAPFGEQRREMFASRPTTTTGTTARVGSTRFRPVGRTSPCTRTSTARHS